jgi:hypothetical protein
MLFRRRVDHGLSKQKELLSTLETLVAHGTLFIKDTYFYLFRF